MKKLILLFFSLICLTSYAQNNFWTQKINTKRNDAFENRSQPRNHTVYSLNFNSLKETLNSAPKRGKNSGKSSLIISFPVGNGKMEKYQVLEAAVMHPKLSAKYPGIKSFAGKGINDPSAVIRFSISDQQGLHAMLMSGKRGTSFIDPLQSDKNTYVVYARKDLKRKPDFECYTEDAGMLINEKVEVPDENRATDDSKLRKYRLALSCNAEYGNIFAGNGSELEKIANILAQMNVTMTRVNGVYERDLAITMEMVENNDTLIYYGSTSADPWSDEWNSKTQQVIDALIGDANYDIGHNFNTTGGGNAGCIGCICTSGSKGSAYTGRANPTGDPFDIDYVAHEMGHQFGGYHTMNNCSRSGDGTTEVEPTSGSTIMGYAGICAPNVQNNSDAYFAYVNIRDISANIQSGVSSSCAQIIDLSNNAPTANAGNDFTIPTLTPFILKGEGSDADGDALTFTWEQNDPEQAPSNGEPVSTWTTGPLFRSIEGTTSPNRYMPSLNDVLAGNLSPTWEVLPSVSRTMEFSLTVKDNVAGGGQTADDLMTVTVAGDAGPFRVVDPAQSTNWYVGQIQTIIWDVAKTNLTPINCTNVNILLSIDGGQTFPITLAENTQNDGEHEVTVPTNLTSTCRIKIESVGNIFYTISNGDFNINESVICNIQVPEGLVTTAITDNSAVIKWDENIGATFDINYKSSGENEWIETSAGSASREILNLLPLTEYEVRVRSKCGENTSDFSNVFTFTTSDLTLEYCDANGETTEDEYIGRVQLGTIDNESGEGTNGYSDFTNISTELELDTENTITITPTWTGTVYEEGYAVYIDYNQDGDFGDEGETVWTKDPSTTSPVSGNFTIPSTAKTGFTRMRIGLSYDGIPSACGSFTYGEIEDYTVNIISNGISSVYFVSSNLDKTKAYIGDRITLTFESSEEINTPTVTLGGHEIVPTLEGNNWIAEYLLTANDQEGQIPFIISNISTISNITYPDVNTTSDGKYVTFEAIETVPSISTVSIYSDNQPSNKASVGTKIFLSFTSSEEIVNPIVKIANQIVNAEKEGNKWLASFTLTEDQSEGVISFSIEGYEDLTGNAGEGVTTTTDGSEVILDKTAPEVISVSISSNNNRNSLAKQDDIITLSFSTNEDVKVPAVTIFGNSIVPELVQGNWEIDYTLTDTDEEGAISFTINNLKDLAGNSGNDVDSTTDGSEVLYDKTKPTLSSVSLTTENINTKYLSVGNEMTIDFTADEAIDNVVVKVIGHSITATNASDNNWSASYTLTANDQLDIDLTFEVNFTDLAGNIAETVEETTDNSALITGIFDNDHIELDIFPNPVSNELNVLLPEFSKVENISVYNISGQKISTIHKNEIANKILKLNVSSLDKGLYFIQLTDGKNYYSSKFIKE